MITIVTKTLKQTTSMTYRKDNDIDDRFDDDNAKTQQCKHTNQQTQQCKHQQKNK